ncbi:MAG: HlyD family efflux transporter periplasmic adaptor subunit [Cystobacterineae bacterium]|nr:HlyD family efflux transporter periplasmic adaptor subunit [Cystobacterineae bacterium]
MIKYKAFILCFSCWLICLSCKNNPNPSDAYGNFEAIETLVSAESNGKLLTLSLEEGSQLEAGVLVGEIDPVPLKLQKEVLEKSIEALMVGMPDIPVQLASLEQQWAAAKKEELRIQQLFQAEAATSKQLDELKSQRQVLERQIHALKSNLNIQTRSILSQAETLRAQILQIENNLEKCKIINPISGTVLSKYVEPHELLTVGKPIYRIADLTQMTLKAFVSGKQLSQIYIGQRVSVLIDGPDNTHKTYVGTLAWISDKAEFTPKMVQTREQRVNLVYAIKIGVPNDGALKMGMPAEVLFSPNPKP